MNELQVIDLDKTDITTWDFPALKAELEAVLTDYDGILYTEETVKDAKKDRATLNKAKKVVEDARKAYRSRCLEPYNAIEPKIKELTDLIEERRQQIDSTVKEIAERQREAREKEVRKYYDSISGTFGKNADRVYQEIFDPKWTNATTSVSKYREDIQNAMASVSRDLDEIKEWNSPFVDTLTELYFEAFSLDKVRQKEKEFKDAVEKAGYTDTAAETTVAPAEKLEAMVKANEEEGTLLRIYASQARLNQICDFMKAIGIKYEIM